MKPFHHIEHLVELIEKKRKEMINCASRTGLTSYQTVNTSKELDYLLNLHQQLTARQNGNIKYVG